jgi:hypothetical protein
MPWENYLIKVLLGQMNAFPKEMDGSLLYYFLPFWFFFFFFYKLKVCLKRASGPKCPPVRELSLWLSWQGLSQPFTDAAGHRNFPKGPQSANLSSHSMNHKLWVMQEVHPWRQKPVILKNMLEHFIRWNTNGENHFPCPSEFVGHSFRSPLDTKILECSRPLRKMP